MIPQAAIASRQDRTTLIRTIWGEARGETFEGKKAIAHVIVNRARKKQWPNTIHAVCLQPWQFSCWNKSDPNRPLIANLDPESTGNIITECRNAADAVLDGEEDITKGADHYFADYIKTPNWAEGKTPVKVIGAHKFFNLYPDSNAIKPVSNGTPLNKLSAKELKEIQQSLQKLGYYPGPIDGIFGKNTGQGFAEWKTDNFLAEPTAIGASSWQMLKEQSSQIITVNWNDFNCKISKHFTVGEATNREARRIPTRKDIQNNILALAKHLDKIRDDWGSPIGVTSWYRPPDVNRAVGGVSNSQHIHGKAVDIYPLQGNIVEFQKWLDARWNLALGYGAKKGFVHIDLRGGKIRWNY
jgi:putative chitinase